jgi:dihydropyrimidinase
MLPTQALTHFIEVEGKGCVVDFGYHAFLSDRPGFLEDIPKIVELGVTSFKFMMDYKKRGHMASDSFLFRAMKKVAQVGGLAMVHAEDGDIIDSLEDEMIAAGRVGFRDFYPTRPNQTEELSVLKAIQTADIAGCPLYVVHLSAAEALVRIKEAHAAGKRVWAETCPQYILLTDDLMDTMGPLAKVGPPLRTQPDIEAIWDGVVNGWISVIGSDHSAHSRETKKPGYTNIFNGHFGCPSIETMLPVMYSEAVTKRGLAPWMLARRLSENPARIFGLYPRKGAIQVGSDADLVMVDPQKEMTIRGEEQHSNAGYSLFEGWKVKGIPVLSLLRGQVLLKDGQLMQNPGYGRFLKRQPFENAWKLGKGTMM